MAFNLVGSFNDWDAPGLEDQGERWCTWPVSSGDVQLEAESERMEGGSRALRKEHQSNMEPWELCLRSS